MNEPTIKKLRQMRLDGMVAAWQEQQGDSGCAHLTFDDRFGMIVDAEFLHRDNARLARALKEARLKIPGACVENIDYSVSRALDRAVVRQLATSHWAHDRQSILICGATGTGKTYLACALAEKACRHGFRAIYSRASRLFEELRLAHADGTYVKVLSRLSRMDVLVIDDFAICPVTDAQRRDLLEILEDRYDARSTIITSQLKPSHWHDYLADPTLADAICDRLLHHSHRLMLEGPSRRKERLAENQ